MMGSGKSTVGKILNGLLDDFKLIDTDKEIEKNTGMSIANLFSTYGQQHFRNLESSLLNKIDANLTILATGGGMPFFNDNWNCLDELGTTFFLNHQLNQLIYNLKRTANKRPLFNESTFTDLYQKRMPLYKKAKYTIECSDLTPRQIANAIIDLHQSN